MKAQYCMTESTYMQDDKELSLGVRLGRQWRRLVEVHVYAFLFIFSYLECGHV